jgi:hypothetical protein
MAMGVERDVATSGKAVLEAASAIGVRFFPCKELIVSGPTIASIGDESSSFGTLSLSSRSLDSLRLFAILSCCTAIWVAAFLKLNHMWSGRMIDSA